MAIALPTYSARLPMTVHRDQDQEKPLIGALETGSESIEFDVHLVGGRLLVGHDAGDAGKTMENVYLEPLHKIVEEGRLKGHLLLIVDVKTKAEETFAAIAAILPRYRDMLTHFDGVTMQKRNVQIIISGNRDREAIAAAIPRFAFYDGRLGDFKKPLDPRLMPMVSDKYSKVVGLKKQVRSCCLVRCLKRLNCSRRVAVRPVAGRAIRPILQAAETAGVRFRMWATPDRTDTWAELARAGHPETYVYNTDTPLELAEFLRHSSV